MHIVFLDEKLNEMQVNTTVCVSFAIKHDMLFMFVWQENLGSWGLGWGMIWQNTRNNKHQLSIDKLF